MFLKRLLSISLALALCAGFGPWIILHSGALLPVYGFVILLCSVSWLALLIIALVRYRLRGLWVLIGLPFVLFWPVMLYLLAQGCAENLKNCP